MSLHAVVVFTAIYITGVPAEAKVSAVAIIPTFVDVLFVTGISNVSDIPAVVVAPTVADFSSVVTTLNYCCFPWLCWCPLML